MNRPPGPRPVSPLAAPAPVVAPPPPAKRNIVGTLYLTLAALVGVGALVTALVALAALVRRLIVWGWS